MHGAGNDYIYVNTLKYPIDNPEHLSELWSDRHKGIGGDGLVLIGRGGSGCRLFDAHIQQRWVGGTHVWKCVALYWQVPLRIWLDKQNRNPLVNPVGHKGAQTAC